MVNIQAEIPGREEAGRRKAESQPEGEKAASEVQKKVINAD